MTPARWFRLGVGLLLLVVPSWALLSRLDAIWNGHPAYPATLLVTVAVGLTLVATAFPPWRRDPEPDGAPWEQDGARTAQGGDPQAPSPRRCGWWMAGRVVIALLAIGWVGLLGWLRPFTAGPDALAALQSDQSVTVVDHPTSIEFIPTTPAPTGVGLVFSPGARVDARAYAALLRPAAEAGNLVVILKEPYGLAITQVGQSAGPIADHTEIGRWAVGGHSLGGVSASWFAADHLDAVDGLLLWASFPQDDMSADDTLEVESISGSNDLLATPADIELSKSKLPPDTTFTEIEGGVHAYFGDYSEQPGDGQPSISRGDASAQISAATVAFLGRVGAEVPTG
ncbi:alpha/beta hydrolase [Nakamurella sp. GG22]